MLENGAPPVKLGVLYSLLPKTFYAFNSRIHYFIVNTHMFLVLT